VRKVYKYINIPYKHGESKMSKLDKIELPLKEPISKETEILLKENGRIITTSLITTTIIMLFMLGTGIRDFTNWILRGIGLRGFWIVIAWVVLYFVMVGICMDALTKSSKIMK
jgi:hypothetical protein